MFLQSLSGGFVIREPTVSDVLRAIGHVEAVVAGYGLSQVGFGLGKYPFTRGTREIQSGLRALSYWGRMHVNVIKAPLTTTFRVGGTRSIANTAPQVLAGAAMGYAIGAAVGTGISRIAFGEEGARDALELYSSPSKMWNEGILGAPSNIKKIWGHYF